MLSKCFAEFIFPTRRGILVRKLLDVVVSIVNLQLTYETHPTNDKRENSNLPVLLSRSKRALAYCS